ncbi:MAG: hypothetical protein Q4C47_04525 [Planctomycetia bacterium]|nr:hypothetical protein [Planctomycetia bacterium]
MKKRTCSRVSVLLSVTAVFMFIQVSCHTHGWADDEKTVVGTSESPDIPSSEILEQFRVDPEMKGSAGVIPDLSEFRRRQGRTSEKERGIDGRCYALLIGHNIFARDPGHLEEYSEEDVALFSSLLQEKGVPPEHILCMTEKNPEFWLRPTRQSIMAMLQLFAKRAGERDTLIVLFSGIGGCVGDETCFFPYGTNPGSGRDWISQSEVIQILTESSARQCLLISLVNRRPIRNVSPGEIIRGTCSWKEISSGMEHMNTRSLFLINSCSRDGVAEESTEMRADLFLGTFVKWTREAAFPIGSVTDIQELFRKTAEQVTSSTASRSTGPQHPELRILIPEYTSEQIY